MFTLNVQARAVTGSPERSYKSEIAEKLKEIVPACAELRCYGETQSGLPLLMVRAISDLQKPAIAIVAGTHGDEPASVIAVLKFIKNDLAKLSEQVNFIIYPCINPEGYQLNSRGNARGLDLNREFDADGGPPEVNAFYGSLQHWSDKIELILNLHEDNPAALSDFGPQEYPDGMYLYEHRGSFGAPTFARDLILPLALKYEVCTLSSLYGDRLQDGVISYGQGQSNKALNGLDLLDNFVLKNGITTHCITVETPTVWPLRKREMAQLEIIHRAVSNKISETASRF